MSRFVRNLIVAQVALFLLTQFLMAWRHLPVMNVLGVLGEARWHFAWQWLTHVLVEAPGPGALVNLAINVFVAWSLYPRIEVVYGRAWFGGTMFLGTAVAGASAVLVTLLFGAQAPVCGAFSIVYALFAFDSWAQRNAGPMRILPFLVGPSFQVTGRQVIGFLAAIALIRLITMAWLASFACDIGAIAGGVLAATMREKRMARATTRRAFGVIQGGKSSWRDRTLN